jgi:hypothetical protein
MPLAKFECSICGAKCPKKYLAHGKMGKRMKWLRDHRLSKHPRAFAESIRKGVATRKRNRG